MLRMVSYHRRPQSGHIICYLNWTYHVLPTESSEAVDMRGDYGYSHFADGFFPERNRYFNANGLRSVCLR
jgi:hypothetical protein